MKEDGAFRYQLASADGGAQVAQLRHVLALVETIAGRERAAGALDEDARLADALDRALPLARRRFAVAAAETSGWAAAGAAAVLAASAAGRTPRTAAAALADELDQALRSLPRLLPFPTKP